MKAGMAGFSLIELLAVMALLAMVAGVSVPAFARIVERQRVEAAMVRLESDIALARNTAMIRGETVILCPLGGDDRCQPGLDWSRGWVVQVEGTGQAGEPLWVQQVLPDGGSALTFSANRPLLRYLANGTSAGSNLTVSLCLHGQVLMQQIVSNSGRARRRRPEEELSCP